MKENENTSLKKHMGIRAKTRVSNTIIYVILVVKSTWVAVVVCFLMCFPIAYTNILNGLQSLGIELRS